MTTVNLIVVAGLALVGPGIVAVAVILVAVASSNLKYSNGLSEKQYYEEVANANLTD